jgi:hypothetical protein
MLWHEGSLLLSNNNNNDSTSVSMTSYILQHTKSTKWSPLSKSLRSFIKEWNMEQLRASCVPEGNCVVYRF